MIRSCSGLSSMVMDDPRFLEPESLMIQEPSNIPPNFFSHFSLDCRKRCGTDTHVCACILQIPVGHRQECLCHTTLETLNCRDPSFCSGFPPAGSRFAHDCKTG